MSALGNITPLELIILAVFPFLLAINIIAFIAFAADKKRSEQGGWRVPEKHLLTLALLGGSPAIFLSRNLLRHKTRKQPFNTYLFAIVFVQLAALALAAYFFTLV